MPYMNENWRKTSILLPLSSRIYLKLFEGLLKAEKLNQRRFAAVTSQRLVHGEPGQGGSSVGLRPPGLSRCACEWILDGRETAKLDPADSGGGTFLAESAGKRGVRESDGVDLRSWSQCGRGGKWASDDNESNRASTTPSPPLCLLECCCGATE